MGLQLDYLRFIQEACERGGIGRGAGLRLCELGNQHIRDNAASITNAKTGKEYYSSLGFDHTSIDINGLDGALPLDLCRPIEDPQLVNQFDVLTNSGTSEHVEDQYECFRNIHNLVKAGGVLVHLNPQAGSWPGHGLHYYRPEFHRQMARHCDYEILCEKDIVTGRKRNHLVCCGLKKRAANPFITRADFDRLASANIFPK